MFSDNEILDIVYKIADILNEKQEYKCEQSIGNKEWIKSSKFYNKRLWIVTYDPKDNINEFYIYYESNILNFEIKFEKEIHFTISKLYDDRILRKNLKLNEIGSLFKTVKAFKDINDIVSKEFY